MKPSAINRWDRESLRVTQLAVCVSFFAFLYYFRHGDVLLYGDAVAHTNIARRIFDSRTPGLLQLGTVWLPLPHLLIVPFIVNDSMWRSGVGASIPSLLAYIFGTVGIFRLVRCRDLCAQSEFDVHAEHGHDRAPVFGAVPLGDGAFS
ncbi:MAG TPA: hypothetical protein VK641_15935 [Terriglobales bacterium]|nr:hypothetical protein [Terriglobales bacterium]